jgi:teichuronic acid biosynthesis glycosyltransferase TuaC
MGRDQPTADAGGRVRSARLVTLEHEDPAAQVLVVTNGWPHEDNDSYCVFIKRQMDSLVERGLRCDVLFIRGYRSPLAYAAAALRVLSWSRPGKRRYLLVHAHSGEAALVAALYRRAPLLVSYLGDDLLGRPRADGAIPLTWRIRRAIVRQHSRLASRTITKSSEMEGVLPRSTRVTNSVIPNGVDVNLFRPLDRAAAREELGWDPNGRIALFAADPSIARKRYFLAEGAVRIAQRELPDLRLEVVQNVAPERVPVFMNAADCLLLTSSIEGSPNVVKEALMCNLPVVATPAGDVEELLDGVTPSFVSEPSGQALAEALLECVREPRRSNGRGVSRRLDADVVADAVLAVYRRLAPGLELELTTVQPGVARTSTA